MVREKPWVTAVVVTYNRKELLTVCLEALLQQTRRPDRILVINNASTDGTEKLFAPGGAFARPEIELVTLPENVGGAGGFAEGIRRAVSGGGFREDSAEKGTEAGTYAKNNTDISESADSVNKNTGASESADSAKEVTEASESTTSDRENTEVSDTNEIKTATEKIRDAVWIMDDDTIPTPGALEGLLTAWDRLQEEGVSPSFLASTVFGPAGEPMNVPVIDQRTTDNGYSDWYRYLGDSCVRIRQATFVSLLFPGEAVRRVGLPIAEYFIWGDDTEYTRRLVRDAGPAFLCGQSRVEHRRFNVKKISIFEENNPVRIRLYFYYFRNALYNAAIYEGTGRTVGRFLGYLAMSFTVFFRKNQQHRMQKFLTMQRGCFAFLAHRRPSGRTKR